ncbi:uncharacterized protein N7459_008781 [Penicillium hispanicum]|uniref:uncharacterized protein n=1 Tax=Penicillium hispanicum TaxID=1080232 RepID=UPI002541B157|nr:uncharacterized protein N7459_008781 [Penicillium hispanicum]KAJ5574354.1 hypothetical protein N7459_008781 [Penicillium hispanicum]
MPDEPRRIVIEKSSTVRRRYQRSNKRFKFTAEQLKRIERDEARERRAKDLRDKEKKRVANKKKKAEEEAKAREERRRQGLPDPNVKVSSSQPLLSRFLGLASRPPPSEESAAGESSVRDSCVEERIAEEPPVNAETETEADAIDEAGPGPTTTETGEYNHGRDIEVGSTGGDTEVDSDAFDDLDEELEQEMSILEDAGVPEILETTKSHSSGHDASQEIPHRARDDDEFSDCSVFYDEDIMKEADAVATTRPTTADTKRTSTSDTDTSGLLRPMLNSVSKTVANPTTSFGDSFRDDTADFLEEAFARGCGDSFGELIQLDSRGQRQ